VSLTALNLFSSIYNFANYICSCFPAILIFETDWMRLKKKKKLPETILQRIDERLNVNKDKDSGRKATSILVNNLKKKHSIPTNPDETIIPKFTVCSGSMNTKKQLEIITKNGEKLSKAEEEKIVLAVKKKLIGK
jgi:hypothetical protein